MLRFGRLQEGSGGVEEVVMTVSERTGQPHCWYACGLSALSCTRGCLSVVDSRWLTGFQHLRDALFAVAQVDLDAELAVQVFGQMLG